MVAATPEAMNRLIPLPRPQPFWRSSSSNRTIMPAPTSCSRITISVVTGSAPYVPPMMYGGCFEDCHEYGEDFAPLVNIERSSGLLMSILTILDPARTCRINPAVTIGPIPNSIRVPRFEAKMTRSAPRGSVCPPVPTP